MQYYPTVDQVQQLRTKYLENGVEVEDVDDTVGQALRNARSHIATSVRTELLQLLEKEQDEDAKTWVRFCLFLIPCKLMSCSVRR